MPVDQDGVFPSEAETAVGPVAPLLSPLMQLDNQLCFVLYALSRKVTSMYRPLLDELGITYPQYLVFLVLWEAQGGQGAAFAGVPVKLLCRRLHLDTGTLTPLLKRMEAEHWLVRERSRLDEREVLVRLTPRGVELQQLAAGIPMTVLCRSGEDPQALLALQQRLRGLLERFPDAGG